MVGIALPAAVWVLGVVPPPPRGLSLEYLLTYSALLLAIALVDLAAPDQAQGQTWRGVACLIAELALAFLIVQTHGSLIRPALIYLLPASRAVVLYGQKRGLLASASVWLVYGINVWLYAWPDHLGESANYFSFFLAPYVLAVVLTLAHANLKALQSAEREAAVAGERNRLAREIHDSLAHYLTVANVQLEAAERVGDPDRMLEQVRKARRLTLACLQEVRRSVGALRAESIEELSLARALRTMVQDFAESTGIAVELNVRLSESTRVEPERSLALFRAAQEGLTNVQRHAQARRVVLVLEEVSGALSLSVEDDGIGPAAEQPPANSFGLLGLRERVELLGGQLRFGPAAERGSCLTVRIPGHA